MIVFQFPKNLRRVVSIASNEVNSVVIKRVDVIKLLPIEALLNLVLRAAGLFSLPSKRSPNIIYE